MTKEQLAKKYGEEKVYVVNKADYDYIGEGLHEKNSATANLVQEFLDKGFFVYRKDAEYNPEYLQLIPYVLIKHNSQYLVAKRTGGDERLIGKISLGMGGHINPEDEGETKEDLFINNMNRELSKEELFLDTKLTRSLEFVGLIRHTDPKDIISQDHLGLFYVLETLDSNVGIKEEDKLEGGLVDVQEIIEQVDKSESWSRIIIHEYIKRDL